MGGTAVSTACWLLVEQAGSWQPNAFAGADLDPAVRTLLIDAAVQARARPLLVRRPGRPDAGSGAERFWAVVDTRPGGRDTRGTFSDDRDLLTAAAALERPTRPEAAGRAATEPLLLVCTHGRRDVCCAVRGRPVAAALAERWPDQTWECTHVGGDRFAANLVVVPSATYYGALDPDSAVRVVQDHLDGRVDPTHLRGFGVAVPAAQAAVIEVHRRFGPFAAGEVEPETVERLEDRSWRIGLAAVAPAPPRLVATVVAEVAPPELLTCHALRSSPATVHRVRSLEPL